MALSHSIMTLTYMKIEKTFMTLDYCLRNGHDDWKGENLPRFPSTPTTYWSCSDHYSPNIVAVIIACFACMLDTGADSGSYTDFLGAQPPVLTSD